MGEKTKFKICLDLMLDDYMKLLLKYGFFM